jgi:mannose-6-phosphate isomerase-like protein (cupin superfamily)
MNETIFLDGKVRKKSLGVFQVPPPSDAIGPKRLLLPQGELANFYDGDEGIRYISLVELRVGGVRGNHSHKVKEEHVYVISGQLILVAQDGPAGQRISVELHPGDLIFIATGVVHAFKPIQPGYAVEFSKARFDPNDVQRFTLL